jgi:hypothetical protein
MDPLVQFPRSVRLQDEKCNLIEINLSDPRKSTALEDSLQAGELAYGLPLFRAFVSKSAVSYGKNLTGLCVKQD